MNICQEYRPNIKMWTLELNKQLTGPYTTAQVEELLRQGEITLKHRVTHPDMPGKWITVAEMRNRTQHKPPPTLPPRPHLTNAGDPNLANETNEIEIAHDLLDILSSAKARPVTNKSSLPEWPAGTPDKGKPPYTLMVTAAVILIVGLLGLRSLIGSFGPTGKTENPSIAEEKHDEPAPIAPINPPRVVEAPKPFVPIKPVAPPPRAPALAVKQAPTNRAPAADAERERERERERQREDQERDKELEKERETAAERENPADERERQEDRGNREPAAGSKAERPEQPLGAGAADPGALPKDELQNPQAPQNPQGMPNASP
jgi:hypothetical protein